jgi:hypothetical protein
MGSHLMLPKQITEQQWAENTLSTPAAIGLLSSTPPQLTVARPLPEHSMSCSSARANDSSSHVIYAIGARSAGRYMSVGESA